MTQTIALFHSIRWWPTSIQAFTRFRMQFLSQFQSHFRQRQVYPEAPGAEVLDVLPRRVPIVSGVKDGTRRGGSCGGSSGSRHGTSGGLGTKKRLLRASVFPLWWYSRPASTFKGGTFDSRCPRLQVATSHSFDDPITLSAHFRLAARVAPRRCAEATFLAWAPSAVCSILTATTHVSSHQGEALG